MKDGNMLWMYFRSILMSKFQKIAQLEDENNWKMKLWMYVLLYAQNILKMIFMSRVNRNLLEYPGAVSSKSA